jgi:predicted molibdopterin-dependent oxidoreductase YjgC
MNITINNWKIQVNEVATVLDIAAQNNIDIPSLCAHPDLIPYGGCRLCIVEIEGRRGYPTACTTMVEEGMIVRTDTQILQEMRRDMIQLILSEHPAACLMCDDVDGCTVFQETIRKVGITTGCRWCPKDKDCELQRIVEQLGIKELTLPGLYRDIPLEKYDPFFDRDYNLCIYCGRCVRICDEYRKSSVLSLRQRGKLTTIGPAFEASHIDADCEFCGACVSVCPTGAMSEKSRKWWGVPEKYEPSVCPLCSLNCDLQVLTLKNKIVGTVPPGKPHESGGELCVKGRFCLSELVNRTDRILEPQYLYPEGYGIVSWDFAIEKAREIIQGIVPKRSAVYISPSLTLEEISSAGIFAGNILQTSELTSSYIDEKLAAYVNLAKESIALEEVKEAGIIVSIFLNGNYNFAPLTMAIKSAAASGTPYYQIGWINDTASRFARYKVVPFPGKEEKYLNQIISFLENGQSKIQEIRELASALKNTKRGVILVGPQIMSLSNCTGLLDKVHQIVKLTKSKLFMPDQFGNLNGLLSLLKMKPVEEVNRKIKEGKIDLLYLIGDAPVNGRPDVKHLIYQNAFPAPSELNPDVILPTSLWGETGGSYLNSNGTIKKVNPVAVSHGYARSHIEVFSGLAKALKTEDVGFSDEVLTNYISDQMKIKKHILNVIPPAKSKAFSTGSEFPYVLIQEKNPHVYSNLNLGQGIAAFGDLIKPGHVMLNPNDAKILEVKDGDPVKLRSPVKESKFHVVARKNIPRGYIYLITSNSKLEFESNPCYINIMKDHV